MSKIQEDHDDPLRVAKLKALEAKIRDEALGYFGDNGYVRLEHLYPCGESPDEYADLFTRDEVNDGVTELGRAGRIRLTVVGSEIRLYPVQR